MERENRYDMVSRAIARILDDRSNAGIVNHVFFGEEDPDELIIYLAYGHTKSLKAAEKTGDTERIQNSLLAALREEGYPDRPVKIVFISEEQVEKSGGPMKFFP